MNILVLLSHFLKKAGFLEIRQYIYYLVNCTFVLKAPLHQQFYRPSTDLAGTQKVGKSGGSRIKKKLLKLIYYSKDISK